MTYRFYLLKNQLQDSFQSWYAYHQRYNPNAPLLTPSELAGIAYDTYRYRFTVTEKEVSNVT